MFYETQKKLLPPVHCPVFQRLRLSRSYYGYCSPVAIRQTVRERERGKAARRKLLGTGIFVYSCSDFVEGLGI